MSSQGTKVIGILDFLLRICSLNIPVCSFIFQNPHPRLNHQWSVTLYRAVFAFNVALPSQYLFIFHCLVHVKCLVAFVAGRAATKFSPLDVNGRRCHISQEFGFQKWTWRNKLLMVNFPGSMALECENLSSLFSNHTYRGLSHIAWVWIVTP